METLKNAALGFCLAVLAGACSSTRTGTGSAGNNGISATGSSMDSASTTTAGLDTISLSGDRLEANTSGINNNAGEGTSNVKGSATTSMSGSYVAGASIYHDNTLNNTTGNEMQISANAGINNMTYGATMTDSASQFLSMAAQTARREISLSQLAESRASNAEVRGFASMLIKDHSKKNQQVMAIANKKKIDVSEATAVGAGQNISNMSGSGVITADQNLRTGDGQGITGGQTMLNNTMGNSALENLSGAEFDRRYMETMVKDHEQAVERYMEAAQSADPQVRAFAMKSVPALRAHLYDARQICRRLR